MSEFLLIAATDARQSRPAFKRVQVCSTFRTSLSERAADSGVPQQPNFLISFKASRSPVGGQRSG